MDTDQPVDLNKVRLKKTQAKQNKQLTTASNTSNTQSGQCSFCNTPRSKVRTLIGNNGHFICDGCLDICKSILAEEEVPLNPTAEEEELFLQERLMELEKFLRETLKKIQGQLSDEKAYATFKMKSQKPRQGLIQRNCAFCGLNENLVPRLVASPLGIYICNSCVAVYDKKINPTDQTSETTHAQLSEKIISIKDLLAKIEREITSSLNP